MRFNIAALATLGLVATAAVSAVPTSLKASGATVSAQAIVPGKHFNRVFIVIFENTSFDEVYNDPYFKQLADQGLLLTNFYAITHPSQPNYIALTYGSTGGVTSDSNYNISGKSIVDLLEAKGVSWKAYQEKYPGGCSKTSSSSTYRRKHNPFISYVNVQNNAAWCAKIVNSNQLSTDLANNAVPQFSFYTPDMNNDAHDTDIPYASNWLQGFLPSLLNDPNLSQDTAFVLTFDEDDKSQGNQIYTAILGKGVTPGTTDDTQYTHYSLLRTIEDNFELGNLGRNDASAPLISSLV
ncbi:phosphoesterase-domain-containing protein [Ramicandelaber brevisporus]|nr:phosphoesterase-domain-containing protein [Ramicandelaber brevisporus]